MGGGWALEFSSFLGPVKGHLANRRVPFGAISFMHTSPLVTLKGCILGRSGVHTVGGGGAGE